MAALPYPRPSDYGTKRSFRWSDPHGTSCLFWACASPKASRRHAASTQADRQKGGPSINTPNPRRRSARRAHRTLRGSHLAMSFARKARLAARVLEAGLERFADRSEVRKTLRNKTRMGLRNLLATTVHLRRRSGESFRADSLRGNHFRFSMTDLSKSKLEAE
jgi:hypothetical protein